MAANKVGRQPWQSIILVIRPAVFDRNVLAFDITGLFQTLTKSDQDGVVLSGCPAVKEPDHRHVDCCAARNWWPARRREA